jgi:hypothetical protein
VSGAPLADDPEAFLLDSADLAFVLASFVVIVFPSFQIVNTLNPRAKSPIRVTTKSRLIALSREHYYAFYKSFNGYLIATVAAHCTVIQLIQLVS